MKYAKSLTIGRMLPRPATFEYDLVEYINIGKRRMSVTELEGQKMPQRKTKPLQGGGQLSQQRECISVSEDKAWRGPEDANHFLPPLLRLKDQWTEEATC